MTQLETPAGQREYVTNFWNKAFARSPIQPNEPSDISIAAPSRRPFETRFWEMIGNIEGYNVLEVGCGRGNDTLAYAKLGANVTSIDISDVAIDLTGKRLKAAGLTADLRVMDVLELKSLDRQFDLIVGRFILHHLEPFSEISALLASRLAPTGRMVFAENNARNPWLIFARNHLAGRYGIPKHGDDVEHPLTPEDVKLLSNHFEEVICEYPELIFFRKLNTYLFRNKKIFRPVMVTLDRVDDTLWRVVPQIRPMSYNQLVWAAKPRVNV